MGRNTKEDALKTRENILDTARRLFFEFGVSQTSLEDIARALGVTRGAIYWHFKNKNELLGTVVDRESAPFGDVSAASFTEADTDPLGQLRNLLICCLLELADNPLRYMMIETLLFKQGSTNEMQLIADRKRINAFSAVAGIKRALDCAVSSNQLPSLLNTAQAAVCLHSLLIGVASDQVTLKAVPYLCLPQHITASIDSFFEMLQYSQALRHPLPLRP